MSYRTVAVKSKLDFVEEPKVKSRVGEAEHDRAYGGNAHRGWSQEQTGNKDEPCEVRLLLGNSGKKISVLDRLVGR